MFLWFYFLLLATASGATGGDVRSRHAGPAPPGPCFNVPDLPVAGSPTSLFVEADAKLKCLHDDAEAKCSDETCKEIDGKLAQLQTLMVEYRNLKKQWADLFNTFKEKTEAFRSDQENRKKHEEEGLKDIKEALGLFSAAYTKHQDALAGIKGGDAVVPHAAPSIVSPEPRRGGEEEDDGEREEGDTGINPPPPGLDGGERRGPEQEDEGEDVEDDDAPPTGLDGGGDEEERRGSDQEDREDEEDDVGLKKSCADEPFNCVEKTRTESGRNELCVNRNRCSKEEEKGCERPECKCQKAQCENVCGGKGEEGEEGPAACGQRTYTKTGAQQESFWVCGPNGPDSAPDEVSTKINAPLKDCEG